MAVPSRRLPTSPDFDLAAHPSTFGRVLSLLYFAHLATKSPSVAMSMTTGLFNETLVVVVRAEAGLPTRSLQ